MRMVMRLSLIRIHLLDFVAEGTHALCLPLPRKPKCFELEVNLVKLSTKKLRKEKLGDKFIILLLHLPPWLQF